MIQSTYNSPCPGSSQSSRLVTDDRVCILLVSPRLPLPSPPTHYHYHYHHRRRPLTSQPTLKPAGRASIHSHRRYYSNQPSSLLPTYRFPLYPHARRKEKKRPPLSRLTSSPDRVFPHPPPVIECCGIVISHTHNTPSHLQDLEYYKCPTLLAHRQPRPPQCRLQRSRQLPKLPPKCTEGRAQVSLGNRERNRR